ncbi:MAG: hypothetical protein KAS15_07465 [Nanoarchaeota archaeon]|nr:hypothetical protein [Nanoarchaeota archaeon]MCK5630171.1 hypothetical protein [Nanoarchaeota archaeon]
MILFDDKYAEIHTKIQENSELVRNIYEIAEKKGLRTKGAVVDIETGTKRPRKVYFPCGKIEDIYLGLDLINNHVRFSFYVILANMRLIYEKSKGKADLSRVYALLDDELGIVSEDMSSGGLDYVDDGSNILDPVLNLLYVDDFGSYNATFEIRKTGEPTRRPIVDLDHLELKKEYSEQWLKYGSQYMDDNKIFRIHKR